MTTAPYAVTLDTPVVIDDAADAVTLRDFFAINQDGIDEDEQNEIINDLRQSGEHWIGGGAAAEFRISLAGKQ